MNQECPSCKSPIPAGSKFCGNCGTKLEGSTTNIAPQDSGQINKSSPAPKQSQDERRDVTVLFGDVKGFTSMCERLDPEDVHTVMNECFKGLGQIVQAEGGHIDKYIGDNIMALFGAPVAHEDDPARACRAALNMQEFLLTFAEKFQTTTGVKLQMRIGIHCGLVIAGGIGANETRKDYSVMGDTVNLASRLESLAPPGSVLVSEDIARRAKGRIKFSEKRLVSVKGKEESVYVREVISELSEVDVRGRDGFSTDLIGREKELNELLEAWEDSSDTLNWIEIRGGLGYGKTRLVEEARRALEAPHIVAIATSVTQRRPYGLARRLVQAALCKKIDDHSIPSDKVSFTALLETIDSNLKVYGEVLWFLTAPGPTSLPAPDPDPQTLRSLVETGISTLLNLLATQSPGLTIILDSFELADTESAEVLHALNKNAKSLTIKIISTVRTEAPELEFVKKSIKLDPLNESDSKLLVEKLSIDHPLPVHIINDIVRLSGGNPLFIEELVRAIRDDTLESPQMNVTLPASIRMAMVARLDRLTPAEREFLKRGSIQGIEFYHDILDKLESRVLNDNPIHGANIDLLYKSEIIEDDSICSRLRLCFKQPALQEAAYDTLLVRQRKELHKHTAEIIHNLAGHQETAAPELLAYHYEKAEAWGPAAKANLQEGKRASQLFLNEKAILYLKKAEEALGKITVVEQDDRIIQLQIYHELSDVYKRIGKYQNAETYAQKMAIIASTDHEKAEATRLLASATKHLGNLAGAKDLLIKAFNEYIHEHSPSQEFFSVCNDIARIFYRDNKNEDALFYINKAKNFLEESNTKGRIQIKILEGTIKHTQGLLEEARTLYELAFKLAKVDEYVSELAKVLNCLGNVERDLGNYQESKCLFEQALELWERTGNVHYIAGMHNNIGNLAMSLADYGNAKFHQESAFQAYLIAGNVYGSALACANLAMLANEQGLHEEGIKGAKRALEILGEGGNWLTGLVLAVLGEAYLLASEVENAENTFQQISKDFGEKDHPLAYAGAIRGLGCVKLLKEDFASADNLLADATLRFEKLKRTQESARSRFLRAKALLGLGDKPSAQEELNKALISFEAIKAQGDIRKTKELLTNLEGTKL